MNATRVRNLFLGGCFVAALALTWAGAASRPAPAPTPALTPASTPIATPAASPAATPIEVSCPPQQTELHLATSPTKAAAATVLDDQPPATVQNLRRADRH